MAQLQYEITILTDPVLNGMLELAKRDPSFERELVRLIDEGRCYVSSMVKGKMIVHVTDAAIAVYYKARGA